MEHHRCRLCYIYFTIFLVFEATLVKDCRGNSGNSSHLSSQLHTVSMLTLVQTHPSSFTSIPLMSTPMSTPDDVSTTSQLATTPQTSLASKSFPVHSSSLVVIDISSEMISPPLSSQSRLASSTSPEPTSTPLPTSTMLRQDELSISKSLSSIIQSLSLTSTQSSISSTISSMEYGETMSSGLSVQSSATSNFPGSTLSSQSSLVTLQSPSLQSSTMEILPHSTTMMPQSTPSPSSSVLNQRSLMLTTPLPSSSVSEPSTTSQLIESSIDLETSLQPATSPGGTNNTLTTPPMISATPISSVGPTGGGDTTLEKIVSFFRNLGDNTAILVGIILGSVATLLLIVIFCIGCCLWRSRKKNRAHLDLTNRNGGVTSSYRPKSRASVNEMKNYSNDAFFNSDFSYQTTSQPYHTTMATTSDDFLEPLPSISPLSYPTTLRNYMNPERGRNLRSPTAGLSLTDTSPNRIRKYPGSSPSLNRPTPLGQQLQKQAERSSTAGSRSSIQGSRASISAMGSRTSFSGSRNSFLSSNPTVSRDEMRSSGFLASNKSEGDTSSQTSYRPLRRQTSLDMVPTRESPVQLTPAQLAGRKREYKSLMCIRNPGALETDEETETREEGDGVDENDLRKDPLVPVLTSTPVNNEGGEDLPTKEAKQKTAGKTRSTSLSPRKKSLQQLTSLTLPEVEEKELDDGATTPKPAEGEGEEEDKEKDTKEEKKPMTRLEKLTSLNYIRSSIRRSLKKKRVSFLTRTPESTPKAKKKAPPRNLPPPEPDIDPELLTFINQDAHDAEGPLSPRIHTPSPISPEFEGGDDYPQRYPEDFYNPEIYPETHGIRHPYPPPGMVGGAGGGGGRRSYTDVPMFAPQLSQPTYYTSSMHYNIQPSYPQLSQQYIPPSYGPPQPIVGSPPHRGYGPLSVKPLYPQKQPQPLVGSPPHQNIGPLSLHPHPLVGSPSHHGMGPISIPPQPLVGSPGHHNPGPLSLPPQPLVGSPTHHSVGPLSMHPSLQVPEYHSRRYTDSGIIGRGSKGRGGSEQSGTGEQRRQNRARSPDVFTDNMSSRYDRGISPDRFTEISAASDLPPESPSISPGVFYSGHDSMLDTSLRYRSIPTTPDEQKLAHSPQYHSLLMDPHTYTMIGGGDRHFQGYPPSSQHYNERSVNSSSSRPGAGGHRVEQSPAHKSFQNRTRRESLEHQHGNQMMRHGVRDPPSHVQHGSHDTTTHQHSQQNSGDSTGHNRRSSTDSTGRHPSRHNSTDNTPSHSRRGSFDASSSSSGRGEKRNSFENQQQQAPPLAAHIRRTSFDKQLPKTRHGSMDTHPHNGARHNETQSVSKARRASMENKSRPKQLTGFRPVTQPGTQKNGTRTEETWQPSQIEEEPVRYGTELQRGVVEWGDDDPTPTEQSLNTRSSAMDSSTNSSSTGAKTRVSWNNEIIEHLRTPSDSSERYDL